MYIPSDASALNAEQMLHLCLRKNRYTSWHIAKAVARKSNKRRPPGPGLKFNAYYCHLCCGWHIGRRMVNGLPFNNER